jgi:ferrous iron transport protein A
MPISIAPVGKDLIVRKVSGNDKIRKHLESLGIVKDRTIRVLEQTNKGLIVLVNDMRLALDNNIAMMIQVA